MAALSAAAYEQTRRRHVAYMQRLMPEYVLRLGWSRAEIDAEQTRGLRALLRHAATASPWHRERLRGVDVEHLTPEEIGALPVMTKSDLMADWDAIVTRPGCTLEAAERHLAKLTGDAYFLDDLHVIASGGSSGHRGVFVYDWHGWTASWLGPLRAMVAIRQRLGIPSIGPLATVSAYVASHTSSALTQTFSDPDRPTVRAPVTLPLAEIVTILNRAQPQMLHSYPSMLPGLAEEAQLGHLRIDPAVIFCTSEPVLPEIRAVTETTFGVPLLNVWAASESNGGSFPCAAGSGFHVGEDLNIIELVDEQGNPVAPAARSARILVTNLYNQVMPIVRYEITDEFQIDAGPCPCGSAYLKVADVEGRNDELFQYAGGVRIHPLNFRSLLGRELAIVEYQVRQTERGADIDVVVRSAVDVDTLGSLLAMRLAQLGVAEPAVTVRRVAGIDRQQTGKLRRFVPLQR